VQTIKKDAPIKNKEYNRRAHINVSKFTDFSKLGYVSYEYYPGAYALQKINEEVKNEEPSEKNNSEFNFYEHI
jgi:hypothetical protein